MLVDLGIEQVAPKRLQPGQRALFIAAHQAAIPDDVGGENRSEASSGTFFDYGRDRVQRTPRKIVLPSR